MKLEILGVGCAKCRALEANTRSAATHLGLDYELAHVTSITEITRRGVMMTPALVVDGEVKSMGKALTVEEAERLLSANLPKAQP